ncbi:MAG TPA: polysaccharide biosynthesis tyrosine autokinase [Gemmatimonadaceae bacterium]|nr:polysaccharide biosynthesis tyrosine autokinase [Gemmatimonadaceae bacterium]
MASVQNSQTPPGPVLESFDLRAFWRTIVRRRWMVAGAFAVVVLGTAFVTLRQIKIYDATCTIIIDLNAPRVLDKEQVQEVVDTGPGGYWHSREYYETQYKVITSRAVAQRVADHLALGKNVAFLGLKEEQRSALEAGGISRDPVRLLQARLRVEPVKDSRVVRIRYEDPDPKLAAAIANAFADAYIAESLAVKSSTTQNASEWLEQQLEDLEKKLEESGKALFEFKRDHDIVAASWEDRQSMVSQRLTAINDALTKARVRKAEVEARNQTFADLAAKVRAGDVPLDDISGLGAYDNIQTTKVRFLEARSECADMKVKYLQDHPRLEACEKKLTLAHQSLQDELKSAVRAADRDFREISTTEKNLLQLLNETKGEAFNLNQYERQYAELKRAHDNNQRLYDLVLKRLKDTGVSGMLQVSNVRILDRAQASSRPVRPKTRSNLSLAVVLGAIGAVALAFMMEKLDTSIVSQEQIEEKLGIAFLGILPRMPQEKDGVRPDLLVHQQPKSAVAECVRAVRTNLLFMSPEKPLRTILVTSSGPREGKTTTAISLAITMTSSGSRVLLIDADMRKPRVHRVFGLENEAGLSSLTVGEGDFDRTVRSSGIPNLDVLPCGPIPPNPAELLHTAAFQRVLKEVATRYDRVILDSPPIGAVADAVVVSTLVDGALIVFRAGATSRDLAAHGAKQLRDVKARVFGAVLNDVDLEDQKYGRYSSYSRYGEPYGDARQDGET